MTSTYSRRFCSLLLLVLVWIGPVCGILTKWEATDFCKCICFQSNYTILLLDKPDDPSKPCLTCNKQWCLNQNLSICAGASLGDTNPDTATGKEGDVEARCFQRDSPRDQLVVTLFLLTIIGLLLGVGVRNRMVKAGLNTSLSWGGNRGWWEEWVLRRQPESYTLSEREAGEYSSVPQSLAM
ncbi:hypothetical protein SERLA73DRAFT_189898 [Serpula lacrymans var. lacrymans S7.3]|uniref:Uncharacterized protein n=2 Tax=Serpula lacrymans var. lacrymans TaxID=341189 RepID=F8QER8_SERL3|nr:uncharacterized protein SERLADRAFT_481048 [Serpula lacrymans var. lacrymans S7.9]EGN93323.1 hypothetical protein SERLA73DRAFT_189898 [Serpula lacrymans var. lacrymans S7.3]EGO18699.1 hypothetical protein SERLADRAFT_481048 [Serpula lacrymans var. lacrymans S7.9]